MNPRLERFLASLFFGVLLAFLTIEHRLEWLQIALGAVTVVACAVGAWLLELAFANGLLEHQEQRDEAARRATPRTTTYADEGRR